MSDFDTEMSATTPVEVQKRVVSFIDKTEGYKGLDRAFLENFVIQMGAERFLEVYKQGAVQGINTIFDHGVCLLGNKGGFYKSNKDMIIKWVNQSFDIEKHESVYSMLAFNDYMSRNDFSYKQIKDYIENDTNKKYCKGTTEFMKAMVWIISQDLCAQMAIVEHERMNKELETKIENFFEGA